MLCQIRPYNAVYSLGMENGEHSIRYRFWVLHVRWQYYTYRIAHTYMYSKSSAPRYTYLMPDVCAALNKYIIILYCAFPCVDYLGFYLSFRTIFCLIIVDEPRILITFSWGGGSFRTCHYKDGYELVSKLARLVRVGILKIAKRDLHLSNKQILDPILYRLNTKNCIFLFK